MTATLVLSICKSCAQPNRLKWTFFGVVFICILLLFWRPPSSYIVNIWKIRWTGRKVALNPANSSNQQTITHQQWSPIDVNQLPDSKTGRYNLALRPRVVSRRIGHRRPWLQRYYQLLTTLYPESIEHGSWVYRGYQMEQVLRIDSKAYNYHLYPQLVDLEGVVKAIRSGKSIESPPINDPSLFIFRSPSNTCEATVDNSTKYDLLVFIKSCVLCLDRRERARQTFMQRNLWGDFHIKFIFVTGLPPANYTGAFHFDGYRIQLESHGNDRGDKAAVRKQLITEANKYDDLLIGEFDDHYYNLPIKQLFTFRWASVFCNGLTDLFLFLDDDMAVIPRKLVRLVQSIPTSVSGDVVLGIHDKFQIVRRPHQLRNRWSVSQNEFPWPIFAPYFFGPAYLLGHDILKDVTIALSFLPPFRIDDANLGLVLFKLRKPVYGTTLFTHLSHDPKGVSRFVILTRRVADKGINWTAEQLAATNSIKWLQS